VLAGRGHPFSCSLHPTPPGPSGEPAFAKDLVARTRGLVTVRARAYVPSGPLGSYRYMDLVRKSEE
jgi:hypothetical protein